MPRKSKIKLCYLLAGLIVGLAGIPSKQIVRAESCPDLRIVFARGSGGERWNDQNYLAFKDTIESKLTTTTLDYEFIDLDYPAISVGADNLGTTLGAYVGAGEAYAFGASVKTGATNLIKLVNSTSCPNTKYVMGGYSQGAMVVSKSLSSLNIDKVIYAATFGDPKLYLPEGEGIMPAACRGENLSDYRMYVPDCQAYKGLLGAYVPYEPLEMAGKVGTWCNKRDIFCSSHLSVSDHVSYISDNLYEDASRVIFDKITKTFGVENTVSSPHDTAILIDSTGSMGSMIEKYKKEAYRLAKETLEAGGRVALYDYRDLKDPYEARERCNFETCTLEAFAAGLNEITAYGGGDNPESLLSSSLKVMNTLKWKLGSTKSLVVLTDDSYLSPDRDGTTLEEVIALSKTIDPVNFYIITDPEYADTYAELATATDGLVVTDLGELSLLTDYIMERYDSLPRVEETSVEKAELPNLMVTRVEWDGETSGTIAWETTGTKTMIIVEDKILGVTTETEITITDLVRGKDTYVTLVPMTEEMRGEAVETYIKCPGETDATQQFVPKAPDTGRC